MARDEDASALQAPDEEPLRTGAVWQEALGRRPGQLRLLARGKRADGVDERAAGPERRPRALEDAGPELGGLLDSRGRRAPADAGPRLERAEPRARGVEENAI